MADLRDEYQTWVDNEFKYWTTQGQFGTSSLTNHLFRQELAKVSLIIIKSRETNWNTFQANYTIVRNWLVQEVKQQNIIIQQSYEQRVKSVTRGTVPPPVFLSFPRDVGDLHKALQNSLGLRDLRFVDTIPDNAEQALLWFQANITGAFPPAGLVFLQIWGLYGIGIMDIMTGRSSVPPLRQFTGSLADLKADINSYITLLKSDPSLTAEQIRFPLQALKEILEQLAKSDGITVIQGRAAFEKIQQGLITTKEEIEEIPESVIEVPENYHVLTKGGETTDLDGNVIKKVRHYSSIPLLEIQVTELLEQGFDLAPTSSISIDDFFAQFDDPIALATVPNNIINDKPVTIFNDGSTSPTNEGVFEEETPNTNIVIVGSLDDGQDQGSLIEIPTETIPIPTSDSGEEKDPVAESQYDKILEEINKQKEQFVDGGFIPEAAGDTGEDSDNQSVEKEKGFSFKGINFTATQIIILVIAILAAMIGFGGAFVA